MIKLFFLILFAFFILLCHGQTSLTIEFTNIRNHTGQICLGLYASYDDYEVKKPLLYKTIHKTELKDGKLIAVIENLAPGTYGVAMLDDEDLNWEMTYGFLLPKEGFAFSDYYHTGFTPPDFNDFKFELGNENKTVEMKIRYL